MAQQLHIHEWNVQPVSPSPGEQNTVEVTFHISNIQGQQEFANAFNAGKNILDGGSADPLDYFTVLMGLYQLIKKSLKKAKAA